MALLFFGGLAVSLLFEQCLVLSLKLSVDRCTLLRANFPLQFAWTAEYIPEAPAGLPANAPVRCGSESLSGAVIQGRVTFKDPAEAHSLPGGEYPCWRGVNPQNPKSNGRYMLPPDREIGTRLAGKHQGSRQKYLKTPW